MEKNVNETGGKRTSGQEINRTHDNRRLKEGKDLSYDKLPYEDPAITNPEELATFPIKSKMSKPEDIEEERDSHLTSRQTSPVREGKNITRTDNNPENDGYL